MTLLQQESTAQLLDGLFESGDAGWGNFRGAKLKRRGLSSQIFYFNFKSLSELSTEFPKGLQKVGCSFGFLIFDFDALASDPSHCDSYVRTRDLLLIGKLCEIRLQLTFRG